MKPVAKDIVYPGCIYGEPIECNQFLSCHQIKEIREGSANSMKVDYLKMRRENKLQGCKGGIYSTIFHPVRRRQGKGV